MKKILLALFSHRTLAIGRWDLYFLRLRLMNRLTFQRRRIKAFLATRTKPLYLNVGSGPRGVDSTQWVNIDGFKDTNVHFLLDLSKPLPFPDGTFDGAFCEHVVEHFDLEDGRTLAAEIQRVLKPGGVFRVIVPDAEWVLKQYFEGDVQKHRGRETRMEAVNSYFRQRYEHQFMYDGETMQRMLGQAGFSESRVEGFRKGSPALADLDDARYAAESLYVDAVK